MKTQKSTLPSFQRIQQEQSREEIEDIAKIEIAFGFELSASAIMKLFQEVALEVNFELIEMESNYATAIRQNQKSLLQFMDCFNWFSQSSITAVKLTLKTSEQNSKRICSIKGLIGSRKQVQEFIQAFKKKSLELLKANNLPHQQQDMESTVDDPDNPFHLEACANYMFNQILSNSKYSIGSSISSTLNSLINEYEDAEFAASKLPEPVISAIRLVQESVDNLYKDFNYGKKEMARVMPYCRISVQKYIFEKLDNIIIGAYRYKFGVGTEKFLQKKDRIFSTMQPSAILEDISLNKQFWFFVKPLEQLGQMMPMVFRKATKYEPVCRELEKIQYVKNPRQKMKHCEMMFALLKTLVFEELHKELINMEDILPLCILIILLSDINELQAELALIEDFLNAEKSEMEGQKRILVSLMQSYNYVLNDWKM